MFSQTAVYALRAVAFLAAHAAEGPVQAQTIAQAMEIPKNFLSKILHQLVRSGWVRSARGIHGGFVLSRPAHEITMADVLAEFTDLGTYRRCILGRSTCDGSCSVHERWKAVVAEIDEILQTTTVDGIL